MAAFRRLFFVALIAGLAAGLVVSVIHAVKLWPMIAQAEVFEAAAPHAEHGGDGQEWTPEGLMRPALSVLFNIAAGIGFGLILNAVIRLRTLAAGQELTPAQGVLWGLAGFAAFTLAPAIGLPPELPGMDSGDVLHRQLWWVAAVLCSAAALALWVFRSGSWRFVAVMLALIPHLAHVPHGDMHGQAHGGGVPPELAAHFVAASLAASAVFWVVLGGVSGWAQQRWARAA